MLPLFNQEPIPLPVPLTPAEHTQSVSGDIMMTWTDMVPVDGTILLSISALWVLALLGYSFMQFFRTPRQSESNPEA